MRWRPWMLVFATACGRLSFDPTATLLADDGRGSATGDGNGSSELGDALGNTGPCPAPIVSDGFENGALDPTWTTSIDPRIALFETGGHTVFSFASPAMGTTSMTSPVLDLSGRCVTLTIANIRGATNSTTGIEIGTASARIRVQVVTNQLSAIDMPFTTIPPTFTYDAAVHSRWRVQLSATRVVVVTLDASGNPAQLLRDLPLFFDATASQITLYSGVNSGNVSGGTAELDAIQY